MPPKWFFVKPYFLEAFELSELGTLQTSQCQLVFSASIGSFQGLPAEVLEVILLPQRLALKYNTTPPAPCQHFLTDFFQVFCAHPKTAANCRENRAAAAAGSRLLYNNYKYIYSPCFLDKQAGTTYYEVSSI